MSLTPRQQRFVEEYLIDLNATQAAIRAGYSQRTANEQAAQLLAKLSIQEAIQEKQKIISEATQIKAEDVLKELAIVAFADMKNYATVDPGGGITLKAFEDMPEGATKAISKLKEKRKILEADGEKGHQNMVIDSQMEFGHHDKIKALELLGRHLGIFNDKLKLQGDPEKPLNVTADLSTATHDEVMEFIRKKTHGEKK